MFEFPEIYQQGDLDKQWRYLKSKYSPETIRLMVKIYSAELDAVRKGVWGDDDIEFFNINGRHLGGDSGHQYFSQWIVYNDETVNFLNKLKKAYAVKLYEKFMRVGESKYGFILEWIDEDGNLDEVIKSDYHLE